MLICEPVPDQRIDCPFVIYKLVIGYSGAKKQNVLNQDLFNELTNRLTDFLPEAFKWSQAVRLIDVSDRGKLTLIADHMKQEATVYIDNKSLFEQRIAVRCLTFTKEMN